MQRRENQELDEAVFAAYGWPATLSDDAILERLVALNAQRATEEANGLIRWLHPEFQNPSTHPTAAPAVQEGLDLPDAKAAQIAVLLEAMSALGQIRQTQGRFAAEAGLMDVQQVPPRIAPMADRHALDSWKSYNRSRFEPHHFCMPEQDAR
jgi:hypothetical protein